MFIHSDHKKHLPYLIFILAVILLGFSPAIFRTYLFHDDIFFWEAPSSLNKFPYICSIDLFLGRFLGTLILWSYFFIVKTVPDLNNIRLMTGLVIAFCALGSYRIIIKYLQRPMDAALTAVMLFSLPAFEVWVSHVGESFEVYALVFVIFAVYAVDKIPLNGPLVKRMTGTASLLSIISLVLSCTVYPALATFYWAMSAFLILSQMETGVEFLRKKIENIYFPGLSAVLIYACIYKFRNYLTGLGFMADGRGYQPDRVVSNIPDKLLWFFKTVIPQSLNLWNIFPLKSFTMLLGLFLAGAVLLALKDEWRKSRSKHFGVTVIAGSLIIFSLLLFSYLPNLLGAVNFNPYRCGAGLTALCLIFLIMALKIYCQFIPAFARSSVLTLILCVFCFWGIYRCFGNIDRFRARISNVEYSYLMRSMANFHGTIKEIYFIPPHPNGLYHYYDEFGEVTFAFDNYNSIVRLINALVVEIEAQNGLKWVSIQRLIPTEELKSEAREFYRQNSTYKYIFKNKSDDGSKMSPYHAFEIRIILGGSIHPKLSDSTLLIDMNNLIGPVKQIMGQYYNFKVINKGSWE